MIARVVYPLLGLCATVRIHVLTHRLSLSAGYT